MRIISLTLDDRADQVLADLESKTGLPPAVLFSLSLSLTQWTYQQRVHDRVIATLDESRRSYRVLDLRAICRSLEMAAKAERTKAEQVLQQPAAAA